MSTEQSTEQRLLHIDPGARGSTVLIPGRKKEYYLHPYSYNLYPTLYPEPIVYF